MSTWKILGKVWKISSVITVPPLLGLMVLLVDASFGRCAASDIYCLSVGQIIPLVVSVYVVVTIAILLITLLILFLRFLVGKLRQDKQGK